MQQSNKNNGKYSPFSGNDSTYYPAGAVPRPKISSDRGTQN